MVQDMNEKGRWSALGGLFAVARAAAATARKVYELSLPLSLSLVYQSLRFRNYFYVPSSKAGHARAQRLSRDRSRIHPKFADLKRSARFHSFRAKIFGMKNSSPRSYKKGLFFLYN